MDAGYKTSWICKKVIDDGRIPSLRIRDHRIKKEGFKSHEYVYDEYNNCVICPNNKVLNYTTTNRNGYREFKSNPKDCEQCPCRDKCTESKNHQKVVTRHIWQNYLESAEDIRHSDIGKNSYALRSITIERVFADAKEKHSMR